MDLPEMLDSVSVPVPDDAAPLEAVGGKPCVIYEFSLGDYVYFGRHYLKAGHRLADWPETGVGRLPDGYDGSGIQPWKSIKAKYGIDNATWVIIETFEGEPHAVIRAAEEDAIAAAKVIFGSRCANKGDSDGFTSEEARAHFAKLNDDPEFRARWEKALAAGNRAKALDPTWKESNRAKLNRMWKDPAFRERHAEATRLNWQDPAFREHQAEAVRASAPITTPTNILTILKTDPKGSAPNGRAVFAHCRTGMTVAEVRAACTAAGVSGSSNPADKTDTFVASGLRRLARAGVIRIDTPEVFASLRAAAAAAIAAE